MRLRAFLVVVLAAIPCGSRAGEREIVADLETFFRSSDVAERERLAGRIATDPGFRREGLRGLLHRMRLYPPLAPGRHAISVPVGYGQSRSVSLRVPRGYTPDRPWPLIYALHPSGGDGPSFIPFVEQLLGPRVEEFVVAAPTNYHQTGLDAPPPFTVDHLAILRAVRQTLHVDGGRQYALGFSLGGYASWAVACLHSEELAGAVPISSAFSIPPTEDGLWRAMVPNIQALPILNVWGQRDDLTVYGIEGQVLGGIAELNRPFAEWVRGQAPLLQNVEIPGAGHGDARPPAAALQAILSARRTDYPKSVEHHYRHPHQGRAYWLEAEAWSGESWAAALPPVAPLPGESHPQALGRVLLDRLGRLKGTIEGQAIRVETRHVAELTIWIGDATLDWARPVSISLDGRAAYTGRVAPDLLVCLNEAARRFDLDRLRWAGIRVLVDGHAEPVTGRTPFPPFMPAP